MAVRETYYVKRGRKYVPISEYDSDICDSLKYGTHVVVNEQGCRMYLYDIQPDNASIVAAAKLFKANLIQCMVNASKARPKTGNNIEFTERQKAAYDKLKEELGEHTYFFEFPTLNDIAEKAVESFLKDSGDKFKDYPFVKKAYDNLMLKIKLCIDKQE
jgi:hypothetical protein